MTRTNIPFLVWKQGSPTFSDLGNFFNINLKIVMGLVLHGKIVVSLVNNFWLPKSARFAQSARRDENSHSFFNISYTWYKSLYMSFLFTYLLVFCQSLILRFWFPSWKEKVTSQAELKILRLGLGSSLVLGLFPLRNEVYLVTATKIFIKYRKHEKSSFSHTVNSVCLSLFLNVQSPVRWQHII